MKENDPNTESHGAAILCPELCVEKLIGDGEGNLISLMEERSNPNADLEEKDFQYVDYLYQAGLLKETDPNKFWTLDGEPYDINPNAPAK